MDLPELVRLASADNFRDVAGPGAGYPTADGRRVRRGVVYRSNELVLTDEDSLALAGLGLGTIHDLRTRLEVGAHPDAVVPGATWLHHDVLGIPVDDVVGLPDRAAGTALMERVYRGFVDDAGAREGFASLLDDLAVADRPALVHCTAGKDRTGWAAALLLHVAGVAPDVVLADYLLSNDYAAASRERYLTMVETAFGPEHVAAYEPLLVADARYLATAVAAADASYGGIDGYLRDGLGLDGATLDALRTRLMR